MKVLYYDCFSGISGDMNLAAMIDLGVDEQYLKNELSRLGLTEYNLTISRDSRHSIAGTRVDVLENSGKQANHSHEKDTGHSHGEIHDHHHHHHHSHEEGHSHDHSHGDTEDKDHNHSHSHTHEHRNLENIYAILDGSGLNQNVKDMSKKMFRLIAEAEAKVHGTTVDKIHFHEVGAVDSIVDIVGAAICLDYMKVDKVRSSTVELGGGFVKCAHGTMPIPAPATSEILKNIPVKTGAVNKETTTPTGAAILAANVDEFTDENTMEVEKIGYGIGHRKLEIPNILRVYLGEETGNKMKGYHVKTAVEISCNIDDMNPEHYDYVMDQLFSAGADEVYLTSVMMKKSRLGSKLSVLCHIDYEKHINQVLFTHTSTLGLRRTSMQKAELERSFEKMSTRYGEINIKIGYLNGKPIKYKPEYEDCRTIAKDQGLSVQEVFHAIMNDIRKNL
ncbi:MAG: nickel pincer cofactor biosynthesis protein LarC [Bacteroidales bacterium]|nr:nickel pincer cofactor biosynthesis protein LarC [Bacteroidales bacterium]